MTGTAEVTRTERRAEKEADMPPEVFTERMARVDGCPACAANVEPPRHVETTRGGFCAYYTCGACGHEWFTSWRDA